MVPGNYFYTQLTYNFLGETVKMMLRNGEIIPPEYEIYPGFLLLPCLAVSAPWRVEDDQDVFLLLEDRLEGLLSQVDYS